MNTSLIQSQLAMNRALLNHLHSAVKSDKNNRGFFSFSGNMDTAYLYHKEVVKAKKYIAKLVVLQKALKKDLSREIAYERASRALSSLCLRGSE